MSNDQPISFDEIHSALCQALTESAEALERQRPANNARFTEIYATLKEPERTAAVDELLTGIFSSIADRIESALKVAPRRH